MNPELIKSGLRYGIAIFGAGFAGWAAKGGYVTTEQVSSIINSESFVPAVIAAGMGLWGIWSRRSKAQIIATAQLPEVKGIELVKKSLADEIQASVGDAAKIVAK